jgi:hypothetical protein
MAILCIRRTRLVAIFPEYCPGVPTHIKFQNVLQILKIEGGSSTSCVINPEYKSWHPFWKWKKVCTYNSNSIIWNDRICIAMVHTIYESFTRKDSKSTLYDRCVANKVINGERCAIGWYGGNILSHGRTNHLLIINKDWRIFSWPGVVEHLERIVLEWKWFPRGQVEVGPRAAIYMAW